MIANEKGCYLAIIFLLFNLALAVPLKRIAKSTPTSFSPHRYRNSETMKVYRLLRQVAMYFWGKNQFKKFERQFSKHALKYGSYYVTLYNIIYLAFFIKSYLQDKQHKQEKISEIVSTYQSLVQLSIQDNLDDQQTNSIIAFLQNNLWVLQKRKYSSLQTLTTEISIVKVVYSQNYKYKVLMCGVDSLGISDLFGVLTISKQKMEMKLIKQYEDYLELFSNEQWKDVVYEGQSGEDFVWRGVWHSIDDEEDPNHSGYWTLSSKFSNSYLQLQL